MLGAGDFPDFNSGLTDAAVGQDGLLDFAGLDAQAPELDLVVQTAPDRHLAIGGPPGQVPGAVIPGALPHDEAGGGEVVALEVASGHPGAAHVELAVHPGGQGVAVGVHDGLGDVEQGPADGDDRLVRELGGVAGHGDFRGAVGVEQPGTGDGPELGQQAVGHPFAAAKDHGAARQGLAELGGPDVLGHAGGRGVEGVAAGAFKQTGQQQGVVGLLVVGQDQGQAVAQGHSGFLQGHVEGGGGHRHHDVGVPGQGIHMAVAGMAGHVIADAAVGQHDALGLAGGARGVNHVGQVFRREGDVRRFLTASGQQGFDVQGLPGE